MDQLRAYVWSYRKQVGLGLLALLFVDIGQLIVPQILRFAVDQLMVGDTSNLLWFGLAIVGIGLFVTVLRFFWRYLLLGTSRKIRRDVRSQLYDRLLRYTISFFEDRRTGDLMAHFTNDTNAVMRATGLGVLALADFFFMTVLSVTFMMYINIRLTVIALIPFAVLAVFTYYMGNLIHRRFQSVQDTFSTLSERVEEAVSGIRVIKSFNREEEMQNHFSETNQDYLDQNVKLVRWQGLLRPGILFLSGCSMILILYSGGRQVIEGPLSLGDLVAFSLYLGRMSWPMMALGMGVNLLQRGSASMERIQKLLDHDPGFEDAPDAVPYQGDGRVEVRNLSFSYDSSEPILKNLSFTLQAGDSLGVIGRTGSGKSTLLHLLNRLYDPPPDQIHLDGRDLRDYQLQSLRKHLALVPQDSFLFSSTIEENIAYGRPNAPSDAVRDAARKAGIHREIMEMPEQYDTSVGERGLSLSGGQKQRVTIARALLMNPTVLMLDDALSSVDAHKEEEILTNLRDIFQTRTSIVVTHRVRALRNMDLVMTLEDGEVSEFDTPSSLRQSNGYFARMLELQEAQQASE